VGEVLRQALCRRKSPDPSQGFGRSTGGPAGVRLAGKCSRIAELCRAGDCALPGRALDRGFVAAACPRPRADSSGPRETGLAANPVQRAGHAGYYGSGRSGSGRSRTRGVTGGARSHPASAAFVPGNTNESRHAPGHQPQHAAQEDRGLSPRSGSAMNKGSGAAGVPILMGGPPCLRAVNAFPICQPSVAKRSKTRRADASALACYAVPIMPLLGSHKSIAGGYYKAVEAAAAQGMDTVQLFTKNNNQWRAKPLSDDDVRLFREALKNSGLRKPCVHTCYLINIACDNEELWQKSLDALVIEIERAEALGLDGVVMHPGSYVDATEEDGLRRIIRGI